MIVKSPCIIDISHWEVPDWPNLDSRVAGVIMKATQGKFYVDPTFKNSWIGAGNRKLPRTGYHYFDPNDVAAQVANYLTTCEDTGLLVSGIWKAEIEPVLDAEYQPTSALSRVLSFIGIPTRPPVRTKAWFDLQHPENYLAINRRVRRTDAQVRPSSSISGSQLAEQYKAWLDMVESATGVHPIVYTNKYMMAYAGDPAWLKEYKLWVAQYPYQPDLQNEPAYLPVGCMDWWMWQYSESGQLNGISGKVDLNLFNGTADDWQRFYGGGSTPPEPPGEANMSISIGTVLAGSLNARSTPNSSSPANIIGASFFHANDLVQYDRVENYFAHVKSARRAGKDLVLPGAECWAFIGETNGYIRPEWKIDAAPVEMPDAIVTFDLGVASVDGKNYVPDHMNGSSVVYKKVGNAG